MTVITITTVGFGELPPLSPAEKIFTSILMLSDIFIIGYAIKVISEYILNINDIDSLIRKKVLKKIESLENDIIVCGYERNGKQTEQKLNAHKKSFVVVEIDEEVIDRFQEEALFVHGYPDEDEIFLKAGIKKATTLICALPSDADNLFVVLFARQINKKLKPAEADNVIMPDRIGGDHMASLVVVPDLVEFLDNLTVSGEQDSINVEQIAFENICPDGEEQAIFDLDIRKKTGCSINGYKNTQGDYIVNPEPSTVIQKNSKLIAIGRPHQIESLKQLYNV